MSNDHGTKPLLALIREFGNECINGGAGATWDDSEEMFDEIKRRLDVLRAKGKNIDWITSILDGSK